MTNQNLTSAELLELTAEETAELDVVFLSSRRHVLLPAQVLRRALKAAMTVSGDVHMGIDDGSLCLWASSSERLVAASVDWDGYFPVSVVLTRAEASGLEKALRSGPGEYDIVLDGEGKTVFEVPGFEIDWSRGGSRMPPIPPTFSGFTCSLPEARQAARDCLSMVLTWDYPEHVLRLVADDGSRKPIRFNEPYEWPAQDVSFRIQSGDLHFLLGSGRTKAARTVGAALADNHAMLVFSREERTAGHGIRITTMIRVEACPHPSRHVDTRAPTELERTIDLLCAEDEDAKP